MPPTAQRDVLAVDLVVNDLDNQKIDKFVANLKGADQTINSLGSKASLTQFNAQLATADAKALDLRRSIDSAIIAAEKTKTPIWTGFATGAKLAQAQSQKLHQELKDIRAIAAGTTNPVLFAQLQAQAKATEAQLDKLETKFRRVAEGRAASAARAGTGAGGFNGRGVLNAASGLGIPGAFEASAGLEAATAAGLSTAALATLAAGAVAIFAAKKITDGIRENAEKHLALEEKLSFIYSQQGLKLAEQKKIAEEFNQVRALAAKERGTDERVANALTAGGGRLKILRDELISANELARKYAAINEAHSGKKIDDATAAEISANEKRILQLDALIEKSAKTGFTPEDSERNAKFFADAKARNDKIIEDFKKAKEKTDELAKSSKDLFGELFAKAGENNPFVKVFDDATKAIERTTIGTATLTDELKKQAQEMTATANANALFSARLDSRLEASNLRSDATRFREGGGATAAAKAADDFLNASIARYRREEAQGLFRNPSNLNRFASGISAGRRLSFFDERRANDEANGLFRNPQIEEDNRRRLALAAEREPLDGSASARDRFERQLSVIRGLRPENEEQRAEAERKIIELGRSLDPTTLGDNENAAIAQALENQAVRVEQSEATAKAERVEAAKVNSNIDKNIADLLKIAQSEGLTGVIRIINDAEDQAKVSLGKRPTEGDMAGRMEP